ncbi:MAG: glutamine synthetase [Salinibacterium amurskyense]
MRREPLAVILTSDLSGQCRGRSVRQSELDKYLVNGSGWVPANLAINPFGEIVSPNPFGSVGDLRLQPDVTSLSQLPLPDAEPTKVVLSDIVNQDGSAWDCCPRTFLRDAIADLKAETGLSVLSSFEHEFMLLDQDPEAPNIAFSLRNLLELEPLGSSIMAALEDAGLEPEMWLPEYAPRQWEVTVAPADALAAADRAILLREIVRNTATQLGHTASFSPIVEASGSGSGVHIHLSLLDEKSEPVAYDPSREGGLSAVAGSFAAGILKHASAISALAASGVVSYERLAPGHWSVGGVFLGENNREALLRICPLFERPNANPARQYNLEFRGADVTSNPWIALGALIRAGLEGIRNNLPAPKVVSGETSELTQEQLDEYGVGNLPHSLGNALDLLAADDVVTGWFPERLLETFVLVKRAEIEHVNGLSDDEKYAAYSYAY